MNNGFKAYRAECVNSLEVYGEMHRFLPVLAAQQGWRVTEVPVNHRARSFGTLGSAPSATCAALSTS